MESYDSLPRPILLQVKDKSEYRTLFHLPLTLDSMSHIFLLNLTMSTIRPAAHRINQNVFI